MRFEPTEEQRDVYRRAKETTGLIDPEIAVLADLAQHATAAALEAEFWAKHSPWKAACGGFKKTEFGDVMTNCTRPEHDYQLADWLKLADEKLREVKR